jgi:hypothetical protein
MVKLKRRSFSSFFPLPLSMLFQDEPVLTQCRLAHLHRRCLRKILCSESVVEKA